MFDISDQTRTDIAKDDDSSWMNLGQKGTRIVESDVSEGNIVILISTAVEYSTVSPRRQALICRNPFAKGNPKSSGPFISFNQTG